MFGIFSLFCGRNQAPGVPESDSSRKTMHSTQIFGPNGCLGGHFVAKTVFFEKDLTRIRHEIDMSRREFDINST